MSVIILQSRIAVIGRFLHNPGFNRIIVNVNHTIQQIRLVAYRLTSVSVAENVADAVIQFVVPLRKACVDPMHKIRKSGDVGGVNEQVAMVVHYAICQQFYAVNVV